MHHARGRGRAARSPVETSLQEELRANLFDLTGTFQIGSDWDKPVGPYFSNEHVCVRARLRRRLHTKARTSNGCFCCELRNLKLTLATMLTSYIIAGLWKTPFPSPDASCQTSPISDGRWQLAAPECLFYSAVTVKLLSTHKHPTSDFTFS